MSGPERKSINLRVPVELHERIEAFIASKKGRGAYAPKWTKTAIVLHAVDTLLVKEGF